ncbi:MAG TPA: hypothetical protein VIW26_12045 [Gemmatimonadales bacterium]|jgi:hypothetical protein
MNTELRQEQLTPARIAALRVLARHGSCVVSNITDDSRKRVAWPAAAWLEAEGYARYDRIGPIMVVRITDAGRAAAEVVR